MRILGRRRQSTGALELLGRRIEQELLPARTPPRRTWLPEVRVTDRRREVVIRLISRRFDPRAIRIRLAGRVLTLSAATGRDGYHAFRRSIVLPENTDWRRIAARAGDHVLTLRIPKTQT